MRGGVSYISKSCSKADNKRLTFCYPKKLTKYIICLDKNSLYSYAMSKSLLTGRIKCLDPAKFNWDKNNDDNDDKNNDWSWTS